MSRKTSPNPFLVSVLSRLVAGYIRLCAATARWTWEGEEHHQRLIDSGKPFICAFWHSRLLMMPLVYKKQNRRMAMLISEHGDGEFIARTVSHFGIENRRGSAANPKKRNKNKGGTAALKALVDAARSGMNTGITPDGPRGPRQRAQAGVAQLARLTGCPVLPMTYSTGAGKFLSSWDRFLLPFPVPFAKACFVFDAPIEVTERGAEAIERARADIEGRLNTITARADAMVGRETVEPAAPILAAPEPAE